MIRKNIYKCHRLSSLIIAIPVLLWAISGFMHPLMTTIKPQVATQVLVPQPIDSAALDMPLRSALEQNKIQAFHNVRLIHIDTNWFYQVQIRNAEPPVYLSAKNGKTLRNGDKLYAQYIAKQFLQGQPKTEDHTAISQTSRTDVEATHIDHALMKLASNSPGQEAEAASSHDCCDAATTSVLADTTGSLVESVELVTAFDKEYKYVNRLLPVYKVKFDRADSIRIYVETIQDRFAFAMDDRRAGFDRFFAICHTWDWLSATGKFKYALMGLITLLGFLTTLMGLYIFFITKTKKGDKPIARARRSHRYVSLTASLFTLMFTFSGGLHALEKLKTPDPIADNISNEIPANDATLNFGYLQNAMPGEKICDIGLARIDSNLYWRVLTLKKKILYISNDDHVVLPHGEEQHAIGLATGFSGHSARDVVKIERITRFAGEYGFVNKRLPVWKVSFENNNNEKYYVETSTGKAAAYVTDKDLFEGYSFALLHKHHFMDWAGKSARDISTMIAAGLQVIMVLVGLFLFFRWLKR